MTFNYEALSSMPPRETRQSYSKRDTMLYALGLGVGTLAVEDSSFLQFVYEENLRALPTMAAVLAPAGMFLRDPIFGIDWRKLLHGEQTLELHRFLRAEGAVRSAVSIVNVFDRGVEKGALVETARDLFDADDGAHIASLRQTFVLRGDGGFGGPPPPPSPTPMELRGPPDLVVDHPTRPEQALLYRLSGDLNPLHADPATAQVAGFNRPILHGLCTFGIAGFSILRACPDLDPSQLTRITARFSSPTFPGETIRTEIWRANAHTVQFRATALERKTIVLANGTANLRSR